MIRVTKSNPCPICHKPDWCLVAHDGSAAVCARTQLGSIKKSGDAGWLHVLNHESYSKNSLYSFQLQCIKHQSKSDMPYFQAQYIAAMNAAHYSQASKSLAVSIESLKRLQLGWDGQAFCFPMKDVTGEIIGIRRRLLNGKKLCVPGSKTGLFIPLNLKGRGDLIIAEGNTDTAAGLDLGFDTIGRPSCNSASKPIVDFCKGRHVVIIADNDTKPNGTNPGIKGAEGLAPTLLLYCKSIRLIVAPKKHGDLRNWLQAGITHEKLKDVIEKTKPLTLKLGFKKWK